MVSRLVQQSCATDAARALHLSVQILPRCPLYSLSRNTCFWSTQNREIGTIGLKGLEPGLPEGFWNRLRSYLALLLPATWRDLHQGQNCIHRL